MVATATRAAVESLVRRSPLFTLLASGVPLGIAALPVLPFRVGDGVFVLPTDAYTTQCHERASSGSSSLTSGTSCSSTNTVSRTDMASKKACGMEDDCSLERLVGSYSAMVSPGGGRMVINSDMIGGIWWF